MCKCLIPACLFAGVLLGVTPSQARLLENWPYDKLMKQSDLVVIAQATKTEETKDTDEIPNWNHEFAGRNTTFKVKHALKGELKGEEIKVLHFKFGELKKGIKKDSADILIIDGPTFVEFKDKNGPEYMLFLKRTKDGRYEPVSGRIDPNLAVRVLSSLR
jgi:hypothetical protein